VGAPAFRRRLSFLVSVSIKESRAVLHSLLHRVLLLPPQGTARYSLLAIAPLRGTITTSQPYSFGSRYLQVLSTGGFKALTLNRRRARLTVLVTRPLLPGR
jgi:hypothetical protein